MAKWANWLILAVSYDKDHKHIEKIKCFPEKDDGLMRTTITRREEVINNIEKKRLTYCTVYDNPNLPPITFSDLDHFIKGEDVHIIEVNGIEYIRTDRNDEEVDNLGELPEF